jgi:hypothetical protein
MSENIETKRYSFGGFSFGSAGDFNLKIQVLKDDYGYTTEISLELSPAERLELLTTLVTLNAQEDN